MRTAIVTSPILRLAMRLSREPKVAVAVLVLAGCGSQQVCTLIGCSSEIVVTVPGLATAGRLPLNTTVCLDEACAAFTIWAAAGRVSCVTASPGPAAAPSICTVADDGGVTFTRVFTAQENLRDGQTSNLTVHVTGSDGRTILDRSAQVVLKAQYPNGKACGVGCYNARVEIR